MSFRSVFIAVVIGVALVVAAFLVNARRPQVERAQPSSALVEATGKCAECHRRETAAIVVEFERSRHAEKGINCLDCHQPTAGQEKLEHRGFTIAKKLTSKNCAQCHAAEYEQYARSRHAGPSWAAVRGTDGFTSAQIEESERFHPGWIKRPPNALVVPEGIEAVAVGCESCHAIGQPNLDGSFGSCTHCHSRHNASVALARHPTTCGQCHMGPDHSQVEIYGESKHGALFEAQKDSMNLDADPRKLTALDMPVPTCATCHMSGLEGMKMTHDTTERLSWFLFAPISEKRPNGDRNQTEMKELCMKCHTKPRIDAFYGRAESVLRATNQKINAALNLTKALRADNLISKESFTEPIQFVEFDLWHYYGRTAKHGAFMGGADFVQWHGNYEILRQTRELEALAAEKRKGAH